MAAHPPISHSVSSLFRPLAHLSHKFSSHTYLPVLEIKLHNRSNYQIESKKMVSYTNSSSSQSQGSHLHAVQKPPSKLPKKPTSSSVPPSASAQPKVYNVKPIHFRELVQRLTGASQPHPAAQRLQSAAPPPIQLASRPAMAVKSDHQRKSSASGGYSNSTEAFNLGDGTELSLSPSSYSWFSFPLLSPGPVSNFGA